MFETEHSAWNDYQVLKFKLDGVDAEVVCPKTSNKNNNWIWRTQFWEVDNQVDLALLAKGYHVVHIDLVDLYGSKISMNRMDSFYKFLSSNFKLNKKVTLEGFSRGGLDAFNWAAKNTDKVQSIYADAPVCDLESWPAGSGKGEGSKEDLKRCLKLYGLTETSLKDFRDMPLYNNASIAKAGIPVFSVCGDKDITVPVSENTNKFAASFRKAGGHIQILIKKGMGHHPHSLVNPKPVVDFILNNADI